MEMLAHHSPEPKQNEKKKKVVSANLNGNRDKADDRDGKMGRCNHATCDPRLSIIVLRAEIDRSQRCKVQQRIVINTNTYHDN